MKHFLLSAFHLRAVAMLIAVLFILHTVDDVFRKLGTKRENFALLLTDAARYMSLAGKTLKELYPTLMHVTAQCEFALTLKILMT